MKDWTLLNTSKSALVLELLHEWKRILKRREPERVYQSFLSEYAGFFLADEMSFSVISKLKLGSELETDFVIVRDGYSNGTIYEFIEIEKPWSNLFTSKGIPSKDFNTSLQQIRDWKRWLIDNKNFLQKYLPTTSTRVIHNSNLKFKIIIGQRNNSPTEYEKRLQIASENNIEIRSFDYLTDKLKNRFFLPSSNLDDKGRLSDKVLNEIANPFNRALTDSKWKSLCEKTQIPAVHIYSNISDSIVKVVNSNNLLKKFIN